MMKGAKNKLKRFLTVTGLLGAGLSFSASSSFKDSAEAVGDSQPVKQPISVVVPDSITPTINVAYRNDTLYASTSTLAFFWAKDKTITRNYVENNNSFRLRMTVMAHEDWHHHNDDLQYRLKSRLSPYEYYKLCMHDEISANIVSTLVARYEYLAAKDKDAVIKKYENTISDFYFKAIQNKTINPGSSDKKEQEKEFKLIANSMPQIWLSKCLKAYTPRTYRMMVRYIKRVGFRKENPKQYLRFCNQMYTIGGVNFFALMDKDIDPNNNATQLVSEMKNIKSLQKNADEITEYAVKGYELLKKIDFSQQESSFCHIFIAAKLKNELKKLDGYVLENNSKAISAAYHKVFYELSNDADFDKMVRRFTIPEAERFTLRYDEKFSPNPEFLSKIYTYRGVDLTQLIKDFAPAELPLTTLNFFDLSTHKMKSVLSEDDIIKKPYISQSSETTTEPSLKTGEPRKRISDVLYMELPNFRDSILTCATAKDEEQIYKVINDFEAQPSVLKSCDTKAIEQYWAKQKKNSR